MTLRYGTIIARGCKIGDDCYFSPRVMTNNLDSEKSQIGGAEFGEKGRLDKPFQQYRQARAKASAHDLIWILSDLDEPIVLKDHVNIFRIRLGSLTDVRAEESPLISVVTKECQFTDTAKVLIKHGANVNCRDQVIFQF